MAMAMDAPTMHPRYITALLCSCLTPRSNDPPRLPSIWQLKIAVTNRLRSLRLDITCRRLAISKL